MRYTQYTPERPTRTTLRNAVSRTRYVADRYAKMTAVFAVAAAAFAVGTAAVAFALGVVLATLPGHPFALLAAAAATVAAASAVPVLALFAARVALRALDRLA
ncbi:hypothetical protein [Halorussus sp. MSC15.2]|uniref:hypothetical protein n=1 Tax=Halorussus sp. MSC15.2 TaxID=2283638 RepID=UPI0013D00839|nr:hypothetical protein [Halorussus sp. MSC15.2]NEU58046.1 hypothetical protein [Halorussus sp. MSC15.2]